MLILCMQTGASGLSQVKFKFVITERAGWEGGACKLRVGSTSPHHDSAPQVINNYTRSTLQQAKCNSTSFAGKRMDSYDLLPKNILLFRLVK